MHVPVSDTPLIAEDLLLLLFAPASGTIAGEGTLFYTLGGAVLAELALGRHIEIDDRGWRGRYVRTTDRTPPADEVLRPAWDRVQNSPQEVQGLLAAVGPVLRSPVLDRVVGRGHIHREKGRALGLFPTTSLSDGGTGHREQLVDQVRAVLVDGETPSPRIATLGALLWASGSLPSLHRDIPWSTPVINRARELQDGNWGAEAVGQAVIRTTTAILTGALVATGIVTIT